MSENATSHAISQVKTNKRKKQFLFNVNIYKKSRLEFNQFLRGETAKCSARKRNETSNGNQPWTMWDYLITWERWGGALGVETHLVSLSGTSLRGWLEFISQHSCKSFLLAKSKVSRVVQIKYPWTPSLAVLKEKLLSFPIKFQRKVKLFQFSQFDWIVQHRAETNSISVVATTEK